MYSYDVRNYDNYENPILITSEEGIGSIYVWITAHETESEVENTFSERDIDSRILVQHTRKPVHTMRAMVSVTPRPTIYTNR